MNQVLSAFVASGALVASLGACSEEEPDPQTIGVGRAEAGCQPIVTEGFVTPANGSHHLPEGTLLTFDSPPAAALHHASFPTGSALKNIYQAADRPRVPDLVHLAEHGYSILWYDDTVAQDEAAMNDLESIADAYPIGEHLVIAPWTADDGPAFPDGAHVALTHWTGPENMQGVWEFCDAVSGEMVDEFTTEYTKENSPEPDAP